LVSLCSWCIRFLVSLNIPNKFLGAFLYLHTMLSKRLKNVFGMFRRHAWV
jgi:hypothetical protein